MVISLHSFQFLIQGINNIQQQFPLSPATAITIDIGLRMFIPSCYLILPLSIPCLYSYTFFIFSVVYPCVCVCSAFQSLVKNAKGNLRFRKSSTHRWILLINIVYNLNLMEICFQNWGEHSQTFKCACFRRVNAAIKIIVNTKKMHVSLSWQYFHGLL